MPRTGLPNLIQELWKHPSIVRYREIALSRYGIALAIAILAIVGFGELADEVLESRFDSFNHTVLDFFNANRSRVLNEVALQLTALGSGVVVPIITFFFLLILLGQGQRRTAFSFAFLVAGAAILTSVLKVAFAIVRPDKYNPLVLETSYSFPSGHSVISFTLYGGMAIWLVLSNPKERWRWWAGLFLLILAGAVATTRVYLGVHWPSDIVAGFLIASFWVAICLVIDRWLDKDKK